MAHVDQARKSTLMAAAKAALAKWPGVKWTLSVRNHSTIVMTIASGNIDFEAEAVYAHHHEPTGSRFREGHTDVNRHYVERDWKGDARAFLLAAVEALGTGNHDNSDVQSDYFDVGWYVDVQIGRWNKPYAFTGEKAAPAETVEVEPAASEPAPCSVCGSREDHTGLVCIRRTDREPARFIATEKALREGRPTPADIELRAELAHQTAVARVTPIGTRLERMHAAAKLVDPAVLPPRFALVDATEADSATVRGALTVLTAAVESGSMPARAALEAIAHMAYRVGRESH